MIGTVIQVEKLHDNLVFSFDARNKRLSCNALFAEDFADPSRTSIRFELMRAGNTGHGVVSRDRDVVGYAWKFHPRNGGECWEGERDASRLSAGQFVLAGLIFVDLPAEKLGDRVLLRWAYASSPTLLEFPT